MLFGRFHNVRTGEQPTIEHFFFHLSKLKKGYTTIISAMPRPAAYGLYVCENDKDYRWVKLSKPSQPLQIQTRHTLGIPVSSTNDLGFFFQAMAIR